ncbi:hypothetical protein BC940DRAFT_297020 [Gongronella butleri]|nr:hypothetical protein BC940DRAFT_297020 [Gongronella butleri]
MSASPLSAPSQELAPQTMDQELFSQYFESLSQPSPVGEWYTSPVVSASVHSSPEIATPLDMHLSPSALKLETLMTTQQQPSSTTTTMAPSPLANDLDMAEILNSPLFTTSSPVQSTPIMTPAMAPGDMFSDLQQDLPAALAAFVAAVSLPQDQQQQQQQQAMPTTPLPTTDALFGTVTPVETTSIPVSRSSSATSTSSSSGRKRTSAMATLPPDEAAVKRQKNTDAARRSRLKKVMKMESLEKRVADLERLNAQLLLRVAVLDSEKSHLQSKESAHEDRVKTLEAQLAEAHKALSSRA